MSQSRPNYNTKTKVWSSKPIDPTLFDVPIGERWLNDLARHGDKLIQIDHDSGEHMTCRQMRLKSLKAAEYLAKIGIQRGDHITIVANYSSNLIPFFIGAVAYGAIVNPIFHNFGVDELCNFFEMVKPKLVVCDGQATERVIESLESLSLCPMIYAFSKGNIPVRSMDEFFACYDTEPSTFEFPQMSDLQSTVAFISGTTGTTGRPKGVRISQAMALSNLTPRWYNDEDCLIFQTSSPGWISFIHAISATIACCSPRVITNQTVTVDLVLEVLQKYGINVVFISPHLLGPITQRLKTRKYDLANLRFIQTGGIPVSKKIRSALKETLPNVQLQIAYGMTEMCVISLSLDRKTGTSVGYLVDGTSAKVMDEKNSHLGPSEMGVIYLRSHCSLILDYIKTDSNTKAVIDSDGWFKTEDIGCFSDDGELFLFGRTADMIRYNGMLIAPYELEVFVQSRFDVNDIIIVGIPAKDVVGSLIAAAVVLSPNSNVTESELIEAVAANFVDSKQLRGGVYFLKELPRMHGGLKIQRKQVQQMIIELYKSNIIQ